MSSRRMWKPIERKRDLPKLQTLESPTLDFKGSPTDDSIEMGKDVAALANAQGGTLLIGAYGGSRLEHYKPMSGDEAKRVAVQFDDAVKTRCAPPPLVSIEPIERDGGFIVAINVQPFPGQLVGVRLMQHESKLLSTPEGSESKRRGIEGLAFFPVRVGSHTKCITPEQIAMYIDAKTRRVAIVLEQIVGQRVVLTPIKGPTNEHNVATLVSVNVLENVVHFGKGKREKPFSVPLDLIASAYREKLGWHLFMYGVVRDFHWNKSAPRELRSSKKFIPEV